MTSSGVGTSPGASPGVRCQACRHEFLLPFSCKNRGICPSCTTRRMSDEAAYLVDMVEARGPLSTVDVDLPLDHAHSDG